MCYSESRLWRRVYLFHCLRVIRRHFHHFLRFLRWTRGVFNLLGLPEVRDIREEDGL